MPHTLVHVAKAMPRSRPAPRGRCCPSRFSIAARGEMQSGSIAEMTVFPKGKHDDQVDTTAQFLDWYKRPFPNQGYYEYMRQRAQELQQRDKPQPTKTVWAIGSMEWLAEHLRAARPAYRFGLRSVGCLSRCPARLFSAALN
jgi:hypothetical protein